MKDGGLRKRGNESAEMSQLLGDTFTSPGSWGVGIKSLDSAVVSNSGGKL